MDDIARVRIRSRRTLGALVIAAVITAGAIIATDLDRSAVVATDDQRSAVASPSSAAMAGSASDPPDGTASAAGDGTLPAGVGVFDDSYSGVSRLDRALLQALREAATDAADDGIGFVVNSGWRSRGYQAQLLRDAVSRYGAKAEAVRWVATPGTSLHVSGDAVDIGPAAAAGWLAEHGTAYGLCQVYRNELWHYELRPEAVDHGCPPAYADPTQDPRLSP